MANQPTALERQDKGSLALTTIESERAMQEVKAQVFLAKQFPRDKIHAETAIIEACGDTELAKEAFYVFPRGGQEIKGLSMRAIEEMALNWGNINFGFIVLERWQAEEHGISSVMAYAWDMETNVRRQVTFEVPHWRETRQGGYALTDPRDIYEMEANQAQRRVRACIESLLPKRIQAKAWAALEKTLSSADKEKPLKLRIIEMVLTYQQKLGVFQNHLESYLHHRIDSTNEEEITRLGQIFKTIINGEAKREEYFNMNAPVSSVQEEKKVDPSSHEAEIAELVEDIPPDYPPSVTEQAPPPPSPEAPIPATNPFPLEGEEQDTSADEIPFPEPTPLGEAEGPPEEAGSSAGADDDEDDDDGLPQEARPDEPRMTQEQKKTLREALAEAEVSNAEFKKKITATYRVEHRKDLPRSAYQELLLWLDPIIAAKQGKDVPM